MWKANGKTTTLLFLDSLSPKTLSLEEAMDLSRDRQIEERSNLGFKNRTHIGQQY
jgi:hypothetical protein